MRVHLPAERKFQLNVERCALIGAHGGRSGARGGEGAAVHAHAVLSVLRLLRACLPPPRRACLVRACLDACLLRACLPRLSRSASSISMSDATTRVVADSAHALSRRFAHSRCGRAQTPERRRRRIDPSLIKNKVKRSEIVQRQRAEKREVQRAERRNRQREREALGDKVRPCPPRRRPGPVPGAPRRPGAHTSAGHPSDRRGAATHRRRCPSSARSKTPASMTRRSWPRTTPMYEAGQRTQRPEGVRGR